MPISININNTPIIDGSGFIRIYNENAPFFHIEKIKDSLIPNKVDDNYITSLGYRIEIKASIFKNSKSDDLIEGWNNIIGFNKSQDIFAVERLSIPCTRIVEVVLLVPTVV